MFTPRPAALAASSALLGILFIAACASRQPPRDMRGGPPDGGSGPRGGAGMALSGGHVARPVALLFAGMERDASHTVDSGALSAGIAAEWAALPVTAHGTVPAIAISDWAASALGDAEALPNQIAFDVNLDGQVSLDEFATRLREEFAALDRDHDGRLTRAEMLVELPTRAEMRDSMRSSGGMPPGGPRGGRPPG